MGVAIWILAVVVFVAASLILARRYSAYRAARLVECPDNKQVAAVGLSAGAATFRGQLRLAQCSRWPEKQDCGRECLHQIERAPADCMVRTIVTKWYADKSCVICGTSLANVNWYERKPAVVDQQGAPQAWADIAPEQVMAVMERDRPICFDCYVAQTFRREHPELVIDNPWQQENR